MSPCGFGKYDRQDFSGVVSATGCEPRGLLGHRPCAYNYFLKNIDPEKVDEEHDQVERPVRLHRPYRGRGRGSRYSTPSTPARGAPDDGGALKNYFFNREDRQAFKECWEDVFEPTAEKRSIGSRRSLPGASSARSSTSSSTRSSVLVPGQEAWRHDRGQALLFLSFVQPLPSYKDFIAKYCDGSKDSAGCHEGLRRRCFGVTFDPTCCDRNVSSAPSAERMNVLIFGLKNSTLIPYVLYVRSELPVESSG